jgi:hypothetical protein
MVIGQLLRLSSPMSGGGGVLDIRHHFGCCIRLLHHALAIDYMNVHFLIMHQK